MKPLLEQRTPEAVKRRKRLEWLWRWMPTLLARALLVGVAVALIVSYAVGW
jgi:hypothetical protein